MSRSNTFMITFSMIFTTLVICASAQPSPSPMAATAPAPELDCMTALYNMSDCLSFVLTGSNLTTPDVGCCGELAGLVESNPICLCQLLGNPGATGVNIDIKRAFRLPNVCSVVTPSPTLCPDIGAPQASHGPGFSPGSAPGSTPGSDSRPGNGISSIVAFNMTFFIGFAVAFVTIFF